jgi:phospholipid transport system substrate-binding protein
VFTAANLRAILIERMTGVASVAEAARSSASMTRGLVIVLWTLCLVGPVSAAVSDPAAIQVQTLETALLKSMRAGSSISMTQRYHDLEPVIEQVFAMPLVTRLAVGPEWTNFSPDQQKALITAYTRFTVANYAHNFHDFSGQRFEMDDNVVSRGEDKVVRTRVIPAHDVPVSLLYRMRDVDGTWKVIDVVSDGVSQLALRRSDFAVAIAAGGAAALIAHLDKASDGLMK